MKRFSDEGYLLKVPVDKPEGLEGFPSPRSWTWLSLDLYEGFNSLEDITGLVGEEVGRKFDAFLKIDFDIEELIENPARFKSLSFDGKYMVPVMLASWIADHRKDVAKAFPLIDVMAEERHEFLVMACMCIKNEKTLEKFLTSLFMYKAKYRDVLKDVAVNIVGEIAA